MTTEPQTSSNHPMPFTRLEVVLLGLVDERLQVVLVRRAGAPYKGRWALPGGVLRIDVDATLDAAARRVATERLNFDPPVLRQVGAVGSRDRDLDRSPWALSVVYRAMVTPDTFLPVAGKRVEALAWRPVDEATRDERLAFDHAELIARSVSAARAEIDRLELPWASLPPSFTLGELQAWCEQILGSALDKSSFRRRVAAADLVAPIDGEVRGGANRPAQLFRARTEPG
ncbi:MAG: NUDIX domain-containing protein [Rubrivivax sp.]